MTSFGQAVKGEIAQVTSGPCCRRVQLYALLLTAGRLEPDALTLRTESDAARAYAEAALNDCFGIRPQLKSADKGDGHIYTLRVSDADAARRIYAAYGFDPHAPFIRINGKLTAKDCCKTAFLRGMFLGCGTVTDPGKGYGLEFDCRRFHLARDMALLLAELGYPPKTGRRGGGYVVYYRDSGAIEDLLGIMGATRAVFKLMDVKIEKDIRNNVNRQNNCDVANAGKQAAAAAVQLKTVTELESQGRLAALPPELRQLALLRMQYPELTLTELGGLCEPPIGKSTAQRRFARIREFSQQRHRECKGKDKDQAND